VARSEKYLVVIEKTPLTNLVQVIERRSGKRLGQIRLSRDISWAKIEGEHLIAIQGAPSDAGYAMKIPALVFELPTLKIAKSLEIVGGNDAQLWDGKILSLGSDQTAYDDNLSELFKLPLPPRKSSRMPKIDASWCGNGVASCAPLQRSFAKYVYRLSAGAHRPAPASCTACFAVASNPINNCCRIVWCAVRFRRGWGTNRSE